MRFAAALGTVVVLAAVIGFRSRSETGDAAGKVEPDRVHWVKLTFGLDGKAVAWDGKLTAENVTLLESAPWSFEKQDRHNPAAHQWVCTTVVRKGRSASSFAEPQRGILVKVRHPQARGRRPVEPPRLRVNTKQGNFTVPLSKLAAGQPVKFLNGRASAELLGTSDALPQRNADSDAYTEDDYPTLTIDGNGHRWVAWLAYEEADKRDHLRVLNLDDPQATVQEIPTAREQMGPQLVTDGKGNPWLFWSAPRNGNWELWAATVNRTKKGGGRSFGQPRQITNAEGSDFHLAAARGPTGDIWLAWQAFRGDNSDIYVKRLQGGRWSPEFPVAQTAANDWEPSISVDANGTAWIGYDSYKNGNYDVFLTSASIDDDGKPQRGKTIAMAATADFEAHAAVCATSDGTVWVAYDAAGPNWGKDYTRDRTQFKGRYSETLHAARRLKLRAVVDGKLVKPEVPLPQKLNRIRPRKILHSDYEEMKRFYEIPHLVQDGNGRLWVFFRLNRQGYAGHPRMGANWEFYATTFVDGKWLEPILLPLSTGRQNQHVSTAVGKDGRLHVAWSTGDHLVDLAQRVRVGILPPVAGEVTLPKLVPASFEKASVTEEPEIRSWKLHRKGEAYEVYFGDLHRHTDISLCFPTADGCLVDAYRYALDASRLDFLAVTDHTRDTDPLPWWRTQKTNDLFYVKGRFAPIYGYERSNGVAGGGHRNVFFLKRDWPVFRGDAHYSWSNEKRPDNNNPDVALYPHLRGKDALTAAHTPGYSRRAQRGTWTYHDPQVEPIAEIIQTFRRDYLRPGAPQWRDARTRGKIPEEASIWYALARGHKLGFIASSDHHSTHMSYACVWAKGPKREDIFEGLRNRRTYAATDKIVLEVRMNDAVMGETVKAPDVPELQIRVRGTDVIEEIQVVRNRKVIASLKPGKTEVRTRVRDKNYPGGAAYYYVRIRQKDHNMAWASPIWVK